jgi:hypothetical protein
MMICILFIAVSYYFSGYIHAVFYYDIVLLDI